MSLKRSLVRKIEVFKNADVITCVKHGYMHAEYIYIHPTYTSICTLYMHTCPLCYTVILGCYSYSYMLQLLFFLCALCKPDNVGTAFPLGWITFYIILSYLVQLKWNASRCTDSADNWTDQNRSVLDPTDACEMDDWKAELQHLLCRHDINTFCP